MTDKPELRPEIVVFAQAMEATMRAHDPQKGDSWKRMTVEELVDGCDDEWYEVWNAPEDRRAGEVIDLANRLMMLWTRLKENVAAAPPKNYDVVNWIHDGCGGRLMIRKDVQTPDGLVDRLECQKCGVAFAWQ